jgi:anti-anti-sigma factor
MELKVLSDDGDVLRLHVLARNVQSETPPRFESLEEFLGPEGYGRRVLVSLGETRFIDSAGLSWLVLCHKRFCQGGGKMVLHSVTPPIRELLHMMRLDLALFIAEDEAAALHMAHKEGS